jgi:CelD/BcsL family acetyltransferase involved in cellulose biosynthesis
MIAPEAATPPAPPLAFLGVQRVPFRFALGELRLFSPSLSLAVVEIEPGATLPQNWRNILPPNETADGYLIRGLPADAVEDAAGGDWHAQTLRTYPRHLVDLTTGYEAYMAKFSSKTRSTLKRKLRKFQDLSGGTLHWEQFRTKDDLAKFLPRARELSAKTYQERLLAAGLPQDASFTAEAYNLAERGAVYAYLLYLNARPVSYLYLPVERGRVIYAYLGYDPAAAEHSPGTVLQLLAMERLFAESGLTVFDFTEGAGHHKQLFATHAIDCADVVLLKRRPGALALAKTHAAFSHAETLLVAALDRLGLKKRIKQLIRRVSGA